MGANAGQTMMGLAKGGMTGLGQGLQQQNSPNPQFNFSQLQQGLQANRLAQKPKKPALQTGVTGNDSPFPQGPRPNTSIYG